MSGYMRLILGLSGVPKTFGPTLVLNRQNFQQKVVHVAIIVNFSPPQKIKTFCPGQKIPLNCLSVVVNHHSS